MPLWLNDILFPLVRWVHIVSMTLIVGGTLFFELVLPISIEDLKREQQLYVFARARLVFRWVVWIGVSALLLSGALSIYRMWHTYALEEFSYISRWAFAHVALGTVGMVVALMLTLGRRPPEDPVRWMRLNLVILLVAIFLGAVTRHFQLTLWERQEARQRAPMIPPDTGPTVDYGQHFDASTQPSTRPGAP